MPGDPGHKREPSIGGGLRIAARAWSQAAAIARHRDALVLLVSSTLKTEHAGTVFGSLWWILDPLLLMLVYTFVVAGLLGRGGPDYPLFILAALVAWKWFASSLQSAMASTAGRERLMRYVAFPRAVLPVGAVIGSTVHFGFGLAVLVAAAGVTGRVPGPAIVGLVPIAVTQLLLTLGVAFFLSALHMFFRDTRNLTGYALRIGFYLSPGLYSLEQVPQSIMPLYLLNPFATLLPAYRSVVLDRTFPDPTALFPVAFASMIMLIAGFLFFVAKEPQMARTG